MGSVKNIKLRTDQSGWLVHPDLRARMIADATEKGTNLGDLTVQILCKRFGIVYSANMRRSTPDPAGDKPQLNFHMPVELERVMGAVYPGSNRMADGIRLALCSYYGLAVPPKVKHTRRRAPRPATA